jgi:hypothetical protein
VAMLATSAEVAMWQHRRLNGPFRVTGDLPAIGGGFVANSPPHWTQMNAAMTLNFSASRWTGPPILKADGRVARAGDGVSQTENDPPGSARSNAHDMMSAAYAALTTNNTAVAETIRAEIRWHADQSRLNFANRTLYPFSYYNDLNPLFMICIWAIDLVLAYDAVRATLGFSDARIEQWFLDLAVLSEQTVHNNLSNSNPGFTNRKSDSYTARNSQVDTWLRGSTRLANGSIVYHLNCSQHYNNRRDAMMGFCGLTGVLVNNVFQKGEFKRYMREWLMFGNRTTANQQTWGDHDRGNDDYPQQGMYYDMAGYGHFMPAIEALARTGDTSVYDFSSSTGSNNATWGSTHFKTMEQVFEQRVQWVASTNTAQYKGSGDPPGSYVAGDATYRIKSRTPNGNELVGDSYLLMPAIYYNRPEWVPIIMRQPGYTPTGFTSTPRDHGTISGWRVDWRQRFLRSFDANPYGGS